ncbi:MAG: DUF4173 domain-containing protein [Verrucomicrobiae bacterium]|nr:DUF4173 domain-containing protein [Verrucomicrobiae bacterium]
MNASSVRLERGLLGLALMQGILGDVLLRSVPWGVNLVIWASAGIAGMVVLALRERDRGVPWRGEAPAEPRALPDVRPAGTPCADGSGGRLPHRPAVVIPRAAPGWMALAWLCALLVAIRDAPALSLLTLVAGAGCLALAAWTARGGSPFAAAPTDFVVQGILTALHAVLGGFAWIVAAARRRGAMVDERRARPWVRAAGGVVAALPVLILFGALFAAADPVFAHGIQQIVNLDFAAFARHTLLIGFWGWICAGYGRRFLLGGEAPAGSLAPPPPVRAPVIEVMIGLGLLAVLFLAFVVVQLRYLFGSDALIQATIGMTYAEYARRGFFELLAVALLLLPLLLGCDWLLGAARNRRGFQGLAVALIALLGIIMVSAWKRLSLYAGAYGLTESRLYAAALLVWVALVILWFIATVLPGRRPRFAVGAVIAGLVVLGGLQLLDPDAFIARSNLERARKGLRSDVDHLLRLGPGAAPILLRGLSALPETDRDRVRESLVQLWGHPAPDWRQWNLARARARAAVALMPGTP